MKKLMFGLALILTGFIGICSAQNYPFDIYVFADIYDNEELTSKRLEMFNWYVKKADNNIKVCPYPYDQIIIDEELTSSYTSEFNELNNIPEFDINKHFFVYCVAFNEDSNYIKQFIDFKIRGEAHDRFVPLQVKNMFKPQGFYYEFFQSRTLKSKRYGATLKDTAPGCVCDM